jgi:hypothetical protein
MFTLFVADHLSAIVAAVVLLPVLLLSLAMFVEGARRRRWTPARRATVPAMAAPRRRAAVRAQPPVTGGIGLRHGIAAPRDHD